MPAVQCAICGVATCNSLEEAAEYGWSPSFWKDGVEVMEPACPTCTATYLHLTRDLTYQYVW
jgi:hypothetical protein